MEQFTKKPKKNIDDFKIELKALIKPKRYKFNSKGGIQKQSFDKNLGRQITF